MKEMDDRDPWQIYEELSSDDKEQVYKAVRAHRMAPPAQSHRMNEAEAKEIADLLEVLEQERKQRRLGRVLLKFLP